MTNIFVTNIGDLSDIQYVSYYKFLTEGLSSILEPLIQYERCPIKKKENKKKEKQRYIGYNFYIASKNVKLCFPEEEFLEIDDKKETYSIHAYLPIFYSLKEEADNKEEIFEKKKIQNRKIVSKIIKAQEHYYNESSKSTTPYTEYLPEKVFKQKLKAVYCVGDIYLSEIPLITQHGTFLITGCERIIVSQLIRGPGVYFKKELNTGTNQNICTATIVSDKGLWTKFTLLTLKKALNFYIDSNELAGKTIFEQREQKLKIEKREWELDTNEEEEIEKKEISIFSFLKKFGIFYEEICASMTDDEKSLLKSFLLKTDFESTISDSEVEEIIDSKFFDPDVGYFSIGKAGRRSLNYKFSQTLPESLSYLTGLDFIFILKSIINLKFFGAPEDDIDHLKNKQIRPIGDILENLFRVGYLTALADLRFFEEEDKAFEYKNDKTDLRFGGFENVIYSRTKEIWNTFLEFFKSSQISQYMDETNPLAEIAHKRRVTVFGPNGLERDNVSDIVRDIHTSQYAKLCPIETPEGETAGLVSSLSLFARFNNLGFLETPFFQMEGQKIKQSQPAVYLNADIETFTDVGFCDTCIDTKSLKINQENVSIKNDIFLSSLKRESLPFLSLSPIQLLSLSTNLVPFIEHDDANRGLMGANMQRQAVPLLYSQKAIVGTGLESNAILGSSMVVSSYGEGTIYKVNNSHIIVEDFYNQRLMYELKKYYRSNQDTCMNQNSCVWSGEKIFSNQIIADAGGTLDGEFAIGKNLLIAYMPWDGYNFEDAIVINEKLVIDNCLTSIQVEEYETTLEKNFFESSLVSDSEKQQAFFDCFENSQDIVPMLVFQKKNFIFDSKAVQELEKKIFDNENISKNISFLKFLISLDKNNTFEFLKNKERYLKKDNNRKKKISKEKQNIIVDNEKTQLVNNPSPTNELFITHFHLDEYDARNLDSKSIIKKGAYVYPNEILVGKVKVQSEENLGTFAMIKRISRPNHNKKIYEDCSFRVPSYLEGRVLELVRFFEEVEDPEQDKDDKEKKKKKPKTKKIEKLKFFIAHLRKIEIGDKLAGRHGNKGVISKIVAQEDMPFLEDGTPIDIIFNPLGVPSRMNVGQVFETLLGLAGFYMGRRFKITPFDEIFGENASRILVIQKLKEARKFSQKRWVFSSLYPGKTLLRDGRTGEFFDNPILVGRSYIVKLIHLVHNKEHARSVGPYSLVTEQPLSGKAQEGGQRFGEMESWALEGFGSAFILYELFSIKSDDVDARNDFYKAIATGNFEEKPIPSVGETFITLIRELNALGLNFVPQKITFNNIKTPTINLDHDYFFQALEKKLELKALLEKAKVREFFSKKTKKPKKQTLKNRYSKNFLKNFLTFNS